MFGPVFDASIIKRAQEKGLVEIALVNLRDFGLGKRKTVDDRPYGGGAGMILRVEPIYAALRAVQPFGYAQGGGSRLKAKKSSTKTVLLDPKGERFTQEKARKFSKLDNLVLICGHYEGIDARVESMVDEIVSVGDFVLTGGEIPAMAVSDAVIRLLPGVLKKEEATERESFSNVKIQMTNDKSMTNVKIQKLKQFNNLAIEQSNNDLMLLEYPQYTRPEEFMGEKVPEVLLSGNHGEVEKWKNEQALERTRKGRPDLLKLKF